MTEQGAIESRPKKRRWPRPIVGGIILVVLAAAGAVYACAKERPFYRIFGSTPAAPGIELTLEEARARLKFPLPTFPDMTYRLACGDREEPFELLRIRSDGKRAQLVYSHGIWLSVTHVGQEYSPIHGADRRVHDGTVRGHPGNITERGWDTKFFFCRNNFSCGSSWQDQETSAQYWHFGAGLTWSENGLRLAITGPYTAGDLQKVAALLRFPA